MRTFLWHVQILDPIGRKTCSCQPERRLARRFGFVSTVHNIVGVQQILGPYFLCSTCVLVLLWNSDWQMTHSFWFWPLRLRLHAHTAMHFSIIYNLCLVIKFTSVYPMARTCRQGELGQSIHANPTDPSLTRGGDNFHGLIHVPQFYGTAWGAAASHGRIHAPQFYGAAWGTAFSHGLANAILAWLDCFVQEAHETHTGEANKKKTPQITN
jgi:hypothetical protein